MPFNAEYTNAVKFWQPPNAGQDTDGEEYTLSVAAELPIYFTLPKEVNDFDHEVAIDAKTVKVTVYQDGVRFYYGDHFGADQTLRYKLLRLSEAAKHVAAQPPTDRKYIEKMRSVARLTSRVRISERDKFVLHQLRPHCETLMEACNRIMEAERATFHAMAWNYPYRLSFFRSACFGSRCIEIMKECVHFRSWAMLVALP